MTPSERKPMVLVIAGPNGSAKEALEQINSKDYPIAYKNDGRKIVKVGVNYSSTEKQLTEWVIE
ncbi:MAG: PD-(D/E)XK nuclease domain-containing protein [Treponema sp.]|nr:PD-(D/E)XK nuclease domain-containing protein [Treponema sp.]